MRKSQLKKSILVVRLSSPGDIVISSPIAQILKKNNPNAKIVWAVQPESRELLEDNPYIDELFIWNKDLWIKLWKHKQFGKLWNEIQLTKKALRENNFELALDLQGLFKSGFITWLSGAKERIGVGSREGSYWFMNKMISRNIANRDQQGSEYRYLVNQLGYSDEGWKIKVYCNQDTKESSKEILQNALGTSSEGYAVICPFTTRTQKHWKEEYWQQLILRIRGRFHLKTIVLGATHEGTKGLHLSRRCGAINLAGQTNQQEAAEIIRNAKLVIGVDNVLTHISQALDTPSIALFGPSRPYLYSSNDYSKVLYLDRFCSPCGRKPICGGSYECMSEITPDRVLREIKQLLKNKDPNPTNQA